MTVKQTDDTSQIKDFEIHMGAIIVLKRHIKFYLYAIMVVRWRYPIFNNDWLMVINTLLLLLITHDHAPRGSHNDFHDIM